MAGGISVDPNVSGSDVSHDANRDVNGQIPALPDPAGISGSDVQPAWETESLPDWVV
jgi:hypothetical protein